MSGVLGLDRKEFLTFGSPIGEIVLREILVYQEQKGASERRVGRAREDGDKSKPREQIHRSVKQP